MQPKTHTRLLSVPLDAVKVTYDGFHHQIVESNGLVVAWSSMMTAQLACDFDMTNFPYDIQYCPVRLGPWIQHTGIYRAG